MFVVFVCNSFKTTNKSLFNHFDFCNNVIFCTHPRYSKWVIIHQSLVCFHDWEITKNISQIIDWHGPIILKWCFQTEFGYKQNINNLTNPIRIATSFEWFIFHKQNHQSCSILFEKNNFGLFLFGREAENNCIIPFCIYEVIVTSLTPRLL